MILGMVCARAGSQGIPDKNLLGIGGMTLLERAIAKAILSDHIEVVYVSTDIDTTELQEHTTDIDKPIIWQHRPSHLAGPKISKWPVFQYIVQNAESVFEPVHLAVDIDVSRPLTTHTDVDNTIRAYMKSEAPVVLAVSRAKKSPWQDTYIVQPDGLLGTALPHGAAARQDQPPSYEHGGIMAVDRDALFAVDDMWGLKVDWNIIDRSHTFDIDDELDYVIACAVHEA